MSNSKRSVQEIANEIYSSIAKFQQSMIYEEGDDVTNKLSSLIDELSYCIAFTSDVQEKITRAFNILDPSSDQVNTLDKLLSIQTIVVEITGIFPPPPPRKKGNFSSIKPKEANGNRRSGGFLNRQSKLGNSCPQERAFLRRETTAVASPPSIASLTSGSSSSTESLQPKPDPINVLNLISDEATPENLYHIFERVKEMLEKKKKDIEVQQIKPNYTKVFKASKHGDVVSVFRECEANATALKIIAGMDIKKAICQYFDRIDTFTMEKNGVPTQLDIAGFAIRKSSTKSRIIAAMTRMTHFLQEHEVENDEMWLRMEQYERIAYVRLIELTASIPSLIEDITCFGALEKLTELDLAANELKSACVQLLSFIPEVYMKAAEVAGKKMENSLIEATASINEIIGLAISKLNEIDIHSGNSSGGILAVESSTKALQAAGSELLAVVWQIVHFGPKDEGKLVFQPYEKAVLRTDRGYRLEHISLLELLAVCTSIMNNLKLYIGALRTVGEHNTPITPRIGCADSNKVISSKGKIIAGGLVGLLVESRRNESVKGVVYPMMAQYGSQIGEVLRKLPHEHCPVITQSIIQTLYSDVNTNQIWDFLNEKNTPLFEALKRRMNNSEDAKKKERARCLTPIYDFIVPSEPKSPMMVFAEVDSMTIARQLVAISFKQYSQMKVNDFFSKSSIIQLIQARINDISNWTTNSVLTFTDIESRAFMKIQFMDILKKLIKLGDFNSAFGVFDGLLHISISFGTKYISEKMNKIMDSTEKLFGNYKNLKLTYKKHTCCIPYIGSVLESIEEVKRNEPSFYQPKGEEEKLINLVQVKEIYDVVMDYLKYQKEEYNIATIEPLHAYLVNLPYFDKSILDKLREYHE